MALLARSQAIVRACQLETVSRARELVITYLPYQPLSPATHESYPLRPRKLLLHRRQTISSGTAQKVSRVPLGFISLRSGKAKSKRSGQRNARVTTGVRHQESRVAARGAAGDEGQQAIKGTGYFFSGHFAQAPPSPVEKQPVPFFLRGSYGPARVTDSERLFTRPALGCAKTYPFSPVL